MRCDGDCWRPWPPAWRWRSRPTPWQWQLNMGQGVTQTSQHRLRRAHDGAVGVRGDRRHRVRRDGLGDVQVPQVQGRGRGAVQPQHHGRDHLDDGADHRLVAMAWPATGKLIKQYDTRDSAMTVKVTGYQWMWKYEYLRRRRRAAPAASIATATASARAASGRRSRPTRITCSTSTTRWCCRSTPRSAS